MNVLIQPEKRVKICSCINCGAYPELIETEYYCQLKCKCGCETKTYGGWYYTDYINSYEAREMAVDEWNKQNNLIVSYEAYEAESKLMRKIYSNKTVTFTADNSKFNLEILKYLERT